MKPGDQMPDGSIYAGVSPDTSRAMYTTPADGPLICAFDAAVAYAAQLNAEKYLGHDDWRIPPKDELRMLFSKKGAICGFNECGSYPAGWYRSSSVIDWSDTWSERFDDGSLGSLGKLSYTSLRCVRG